MQAYAVDLNDAQVNEVKRRYGATSNAEVRNAIQKIVEEALNGNASQMSELQQHQCRAKTKALALQPLR